LFILLSFSAAKPLLFTLLSSLARYRHNHSLALHRLRFPYRREDPVDNNRRWFLGPIVAFFDNHIASTLQTSTIRYLITPRQPDTTSHLGNRVKLIVHPFVFPIGGLRSSKLKQKVKSSKNALIEKDFAFWVVCKIKKTYSEMPSNQLFTSLVRG